MQPLEIGLLISSLCPDRIQAFHAAQALGFTSGHTTRIPEPWFAGPERGQYIEAVRHTGFHITTMFVGFDGQRYTDLATMRWTMGLVNPETQAERKQVVFQYSALARELGVTRLGAHLGFVPEDPDHPHYRPLVDTVREVLDHLERHGQDLVLETGQEPAGVLLRFIRAVDRPGLGVNFDPANLLLYGTGRPLEALDLLQAHVRGVHCKDALSPKEAGTLGREVPLGQGEVDFPGFLRRLLDTGYTGPLTIEREAGPTTSADVLKARDYLKHLIAELEPSR
jgi:sugar phosphate isomerase/epimerase